MPHSPLLLHPSAADAGGRVHHVTPESAGWTYVGFDAHDLPDGGSIAAETGAREVCIVMVSGRARVTAGDRDFGVIGERASVFEGRPWSVYVPANSRFTVAAEGACEVAVCSAPGTGARPALLIPPEDVSEETRGKGSNTRHVRNILADTDERAESPAGGRGGDAAGPTGRATRPTSTIATPSRTRLCWRKPTTTASRRPRATGCSGSTRTTARSTRR